MIKRVRAAASFKRASAAQRIRGAAVFALSFALIAASLPAVSVNAVEPKGSGTEGNYIAADMSEYFGGHEGSFVLYDSAADVYTIYNEKLSGERVSPDSTYKIFSALAALESGTISPTDSYMAWDGEENFFDEWNRDQDLETAMKNSVNWYFDRLNEEDMESLKAVFSAFDYGNEKTNGENFWMEGSLKISPKEQVDALKELYFNEHGFDSEKQGTHNKDIKSQFASIHRTDTRFIHHNDIRGISHGRKNHNQHTQRIECQFASFNRQLRHAGYCQQYGQPGNPRSLLTEKNKYRIRKMNRCSDAGSHEIISPEKKHGRTRIKQTQ